MSAATPSTAPLWLERGFPTRDGAKSLSDQQDLQRAVEAYRFFYPTVSCEAIMTGNRDVGIPDGGGVLLLEAGPRHLIFTANSDTPYACAVLDLLPRPYVVELPPGPYLGVVDDHHQRWVADVGIPGPDAGRGGRYLLLPPGFTGSVLDGYHVARASTIKVMVALRAVPQGGDRKGALEALCRVKIYPLGAPGVALPFVNGSEIDLDTTPLRWEDNLEYWRRLHQVIELEPMLEEFRPMAGLLAALGIEKGRPFAPDPRTEHILVTAAQIGLAQLRVEAFASQRPDRVVWPGRQWEWITLVPDDANFESGGYLDLQARDRWFIQAIVASPAMFRRQVGGGSIYFLSARDVTGAYLDGGRSYKLTLPQPVPASLFWSVTAYDSETRSQVRAALDRAVLGSLEDRFRANPDGSVDLYFAPRAPKSVSAQWIQTVPERGFFLFLRLYGPEAAALDGSWKPSDVTALDS